MKGQRTMGHDKGSETFSVKQEREESNWLSEVVTFLKSVFKNRHHRSNEG